FVSSIERPLPIGLLSPSMSLALPRRYFTLVVLVTAAGFASHALAADNSSKTLTFKKRHLLVGPYENATVGDLNRDGVPDIVCGPYILYGPDYAPQAYRPNHTSAEYMHENSVHLVDIDGDGWLDIVACGWGEDGIYWYKNPGNRHSEEK